MTNEQSTSLKLIVWVCLLLTIVEYTWSFSGINIGDMRLLSVILEVL